MNSELISIIVPIYNVEKYLRRCIDSIRNQTYKELEIILVNDGSKDNSGKICDEYKNIDSRIIVIHKENGGLSDARNKGIEMAKGKYIVFIDSDDFIELDMIESLYTNIKEYNVKIAVCGVYRVKGNEKQPYQKKYEKKLFSKKEALLKIIDETNDFRVWAPNKLYASDLFKNVRYPKGKIYEDVGTTYKLIDLVDKIIYIGAPKYNYFVREDSITKSESFNEKELNRIEMCEEMCTYVEDKYSDLKNEFEFFKITQYIAVINVMIKSNKYDQEIIKKCRKIIKDNFKNIITVKMSIKKKTQMFLMLISFNLYKKIYVKKVNK